MALYFYFALLMDKIVLINNSQLASATKMNKQDHFKRLKKRSV